ncbi:MAG: ComF family protein [Bacilli bacterium]|nr:ComF family protein [Bacilli bacterium]
MEPKFIGFSADGHKATSIYDYNPFIRKLIYQYKGCYDYELHKVFLDRYAKEIKLRYFDYVVIPIPSYKNEDEERGFNHVVETFKSLGINMFNIIEKTEKHKQAVSTFNQRKEVYKYLELNSHPDLSKKKVLIVDDVYTTGSTMKAAIHLVEKLNPKKIDVLVVAKTRGKQLPK